MAGACLVAASVLMAGSSAWANHGGGSHGGSGGGGGGGGSGGSGGSVYRATDPGVRGGPADAGGPIDGLSPQELEYFAAGLGAFVEVSSVDGALPSTDAGLGPRYNGLSCGICHAQPGIGGTSPFVNPAVAAATAGGATNYVPWFNIREGPIREARFQRYPNGKPDGGVTNLYTITGRADATGCTLAQPYFGRPGNPYSGKGGDPNLIFRIPTPTFGGGLIEAILDQTLLENGAARARDKVLAGISGRPNRDGSTGTISRFGWKAQNKSLMLFAAEAYNVEQGVTNETFDDERDESNPACLFNPLPEDLTNLGAATLVGGLNDVTLFELFMKFLAPPTPADPTPSTIAGRDVFGRVGCDLCHTPELTTGASSTAALAAVPVSLYSDLLLHEMGIGLADGIQQGLADGDEFRTAPLWGLGQRIFFLHDGRTKDLVQAIQEHYSLGSEANQVITRYRFLPERDKQDLLNFLRSL
jgi:CxxC motif-containing protein (DUF1111 family)